MKIADILRRLADNIDGHSQGDNTITVTQQTTSVVTYYSTGTTTGNIFASAVYA